MRKFLTSPIQERVDRREWDFSVVPTEEERACCFYEYSRESTYIVESLRASNWPNDNLDAQRQALRNSPIVFGFTDMDPHRLSEPWLSKDSEWRRRFCYYFAEHWEGLSYAPSIEKSSAPPFTVGATPHAPWEQWTKRKTRLLDRKTGLELLLVTIDWDNFKDSEIVASFTKWIKSNAGRPRGVGLRHAKGKRTDTWRKKLERLAIMRLRHYYSVDEISSLVPPKWENLTKFVDEREVRRERKAARLTLFELFPFLPEDTLPVNWPTA